MSNFIFGETGKGGKILAVWWTWEQSFEQVQQPQVLFLDRNGEKHCHQIL